MHNSFIRKFCLKKDEVDRQSVFHDAPKEAAAAVHCEAHGLVADEIVEVKEGA